MDRIRFFHLCALRGAVRLEKHGMTRSRRQRPARLIAAEELGLSKDATHDEVIEALTKKIDEMSSASTSSGS